MINNPQSRSGFCKAFEKKFIGPFTIVKQTSNLNYLLESPNYKPIIAHYNRMYKFEMRKSSTTPSKQPAPTKIDAHPVPIQNTINSKTTFHSLINILIKIVSENTPVIDVEQVTEEPSENSSNFDTPNRTLEEVENGTATLVISPTISPLLNSTVLNTNTTQCVICHGYYVSINKHYGHSHKGIEYQKQPAQEND